MYPKFYTPYHYCPNCKTQCLYLHSESLNPHLKEGERMMINCKNCNEAYSVRVHEDKTEDLRIVQALLDK